MDKIKKTNLNRKKHRLKINNMNDFKVALEKEGYNIGEFRDEKFNESIMKKFNVDSLVAVNLYNSIIDTDITYRADNIQGLVDYIENITRFEIKHKKLATKISKIEKLTIDRVEYERESSIQDDVKGIVEIIDEVKNKVASRMDEEEKLLIRKLEEEIANEHIYTKDIELLKKMTINDENLICEQYNSISQTKSISIRVPKKLNCKFIPALKGSIEYHHHLKSNIPRIRRLINNIDKYLISDENDSGWFKINQSNILQDTINIAIAIFNNKEFKAVSGSNDIVDYCTAPNKDKVAFKSYKVNKLGKLGIGYNRINDSEKKILEEVNRKIIAKELIPEGELILYSKWEPCPSCYYVISQFCERYPKISVKVRYGKRYGE